MRNRMTLLTVVMVAGYAAFIEWLWGWSSILSSWSEIGVLRVFFALALLTSTYVLRTWRIHDYFPAETSGRFSTLFRVTQIHNLLNIMLPFRSGETSFPLLMRTEFAIPLARGASALLVMRLLDLHALLAAAGLGLALSAAERGVAFVIWGFFLLLPAVAFALRCPLMKTLHRVAPAKAERLLTEIEEGLPATPMKFLRAWLVTIVNWLVKVLVLAWALRLMGLSLSAGFGGALGGELSSVLPLHAPGGVGTYPAGIAAGATAFGTTTDAETLAKASVNAHLLIIVSALTGTAISLPFGRKRHPKESPV